MGAYFHQDWMYEAEDEWSVVDLFVAEDPQLARLLPDEIAATLREFPEEDALESRLAALGAMYVAAPEAGGYRQWLIEVSDRVKKTLASA